MFGSTDNELAGKSTEYIVGKLGFPARNFFYMYDSVLKKNIESIYDYFKNKKNNKPALDNTYRVLAKKGFDLKQIETLYTYKGELTFGQIYGRFVGFKASIDSYLELLKLDQVKWDVPLSMILSPVMEGFEFRFKSLLESLESKYINMIYDFLIQRGVTTDKALSDEGKFYIVKKVLTEYNTNRCTNDTDLYMESFKNDYMLKDIDKLMIVQGKYCLSMLDTAMNIVANRGVFKMPTPSIAPPPQDLLVARLSSYLSNHSPEPDVKVIVGSIIDTVKEINNSTQGFVLPVPAPGYTAGEWQFFYKTLMTDYVEFKRISAIKEVFEGSSNTIFELIGLLGYMCMADDISVSENDGSYFHTAEYCKEAAKQQPGRYR